MSRKRTSGIDDLVATLIKQHGLEDALDRARDMRLRVQCPDRVCIWIIAYARLREMRQHARGLA